MKITQRDIDSLMAKLNALTDGEKLALRVAVASAVDPDDVVGFARDIKPTELASLHFDRIDWVWKAPAGTDSNMTAPGRGLLDYEWIA